MRGPTSKAPFHLVVHLVCVSLLLQSSGVAAAAPVLQHAWSYCDIYGGEAARVVDAGHTLALYEPRDVKLTTRDGRIFHLDLVHGVESLEDLNGNRLTITPAGITHSSGRGIAFARDAAGRIERITDPLGRVMSYGYDTGGDLTAFTDRGGAVTRFTYDDHRLIDIQDPRGVKPIRNEYNAEGRLVRHVDAFGKVIELGHDRGNRREVVTNRLAPPGCWSTTPAATSSAKPTSSARSPPALTTAATTC